MGKNPAKAANKAGIMHATAQSERATVVRQH
jgi:hypothetical protein